MKRLLSIGATSALVLGATLVAAQPAAAAEPPFYSVMFLRPLAGDTSTWATGINNRGDVVGISGDEGGPGAATLWTARSGVGTDIAPAFPDADGLDISDARDIVGTTGSEASFWWSRGTATGLGIEGPNLVGHISAEGTAVVNLPGEGAEKVLTATSPGDHAELPLPDGATLPSASGISDDGTHVAGHVTVGEVQVPALWSDGVAQVLTPPAAATMSTLNGVNDDGVAVGCSGTDARWWATRYDASGVGTQLPQLSNEYGACATAVNNSGLVGGTSFTDAEDVATIWLGGAVIDLNTLTQDSDDFVLRTVNDVNAAGQLVGVAEIHDGTFRGFIATPSTAESIYTTPGYHEFNDRQWSTSCEGYSQTTRCRTEIMARTVKYEDGRHQVVTDWTFNNLTYTPSSRSLWAENPLGNDGSWESRAGRLWRTECDTPATGGNGCRSHAVARVTTAVPLPGGGYRFVWEDKWVFNNIVKFS